MKVLITTISMVAFLVAAEPRDAPAQSVNIYINPNNPVVFSSPPQTVANIFTLNVTFDDGTTAQGNFTVAGGTIQFFNITTQSKGGPIQYCYNSSALGPIPPNKTCGLTNDQANQAVGGLGMTLASQTASSVGSPENSSVYFLSPYGSVLTLIVPDTSPGTNIFTTPLPYQAYAKSFNLCVQGDAGGPLPANGACDSPYGYPWVGSSPEKLAFFLSNEVFFPTYVPGPGYRQAAGRGVVSGTLTACGALLSNIQSIEVYQCDPDYAEAKKTTTPK